jgi:hypothetical protein
MHEGVYVFVILACENIQLCIFVNTINHFLHTQGVYEAHSGNH